MLTRKNLVVINEIYGGEYPAPFRAKTIFIESYNNSAIWKKEI